MMVCRDRLTTPPVHPAIGVASPIGSSRRSAIFTTRMALLPSWCALILLPSVPSRGLPLAHELVDSTRIAQSHIDIPVRIDPAPVARSPARKPRQHLAGRVQHTDARRRPVHIALADVEHAVAIYGDIHR